MGVMDLKKKGFVIALILLQLMEEDSVLVNGNKGKFVQKKSVQLIVDAIPGKKIGQLVYHK